MLRGVLGAALAAIACGTAACAPHRTGTLPATDAELVRQYPCPAAIPAAWTAVDSTLGRPPGCALVVAALRQFAESARGDTSLARVDTSDVVCVRARRVASQGAGPSLVSGSWLVELYRDDNPRILVTLAPQGGTSRATLVPSPPNVSAMALCAAD